MAADMFLKIDKIAGESIVKEHEGQIDILSWSWGMTQNGSTHTATGGGSGKVSVQDITVSKRVDRSSPNLVKWCTAGTAIKEATLYVRKAGGKTPLDYIKLSMKDVIVSSVTCSGSSHGDGMDESITLNFGYFAYDYTPQESAGAGKAVVAMTWNIAKNQEAY